MMIDFKDFPKQWLLTKSDLAQCENCKRSGFGGFTLAVAPAVPVVPVADAAGRDVGRVIGWGLYQGRILPDGAVLTLPAGTDPAALFSQIGGRFVGLWADEGGAIFLREDATGCFPAIYSKDLGAVASTTTMLAHLGDLPIDPDIKGIFDFPKRKGFLPFGLTERAGAYRLMPNHTLSLDTFEAARNWPDAAFFDTAAQASTPDLIARAVALVTSQMQALMAQGPTVLYLSGGHDSRMALAAAHGHAAQLTCETLTYGKSLDAHVSSAVCKIADVKFRPVQVLSSSRPDVQAWLERSGNMVYDNVAELVATAVKNYPGNLQVTGTGAELARATNWRKEDLSADGIEISELLRRIRIPESPKVLAAAKRWMDGLPPMKRTQILDLAKIEQIHGCWAGSAVYGHPLDYPSLSPFSGDQWNQIALSLPEDYRAAGGFYQDFMKATWPALMQVPVNRARGLAKLKFWRKTLRQAVPESVRRFLKPYR